MQLNTNRAHVKIKKYISEKILQDRNFLVRLIARTSRDHTFHEEIDFSSRRQERPKEYGNILKRMKTADIMCRGFAIIFLMMATIACGTTDGIDEEGPPRTIVFSAQNDEEGTFQIFSMREDGSGVRRLTDGEFSSTNPAWSPDGTRIAYARSTGSTAGDALWVMDADGSNKEPLVVNPQTGNPQLGNQPAWSPNGNKLAFDRCVNCAFGGKNVDIFVADLQTGSIDTLTHHSGIDTQPTWSPDGNEIAFVSERDHTDEFGIDIYLIEVNGGSVTRLTETGNAGRQIWFGDELLFWAQDELFILNLTDSTKRKIDIDLPDNIKFRPLDVSEDNQKVLLLTFELSSESQIRSLRILDLKTNEITEVLSSDGISHADWLTSFDNQN